MRGGGKGILRSGGYKGDFGSSLFRGSKASNKEYFEKILALILRAFL